MRRLVDMIGLRRLETEKPSVPKDHVVFAVGDIHGRLDLLADLQHQIITSATEMPSNFRKVIVYLGNYIDHGPDSADVIDTLLSVCIPGFHSVYLMGDGEHHLMNFLKGKIIPATKTWLYEQGGLATIASYGVQVSGKKDTETINAMRIELLRKIPTDHLSFLENLKLSYSIGDFFFTHAGINPHLPLNEQRPSDLLTITTGFLDYKKALEKVIVHGHTEFKAPCVHSNRIGLNTAAYRSNILSGLMIKADRFNLLQAQLPA